MNPTDEQNRALEMALDDEVMRGRIRALAGTGKTSTLKLIAESKPEAGTYIAFNRAIVDEAQSKFPDRVRCSTAHGLAFRDVGVKWRHRLGGRPVRNATIAKKCGIEGGIAFKVGEKDRYISPSRIGKMLSGAINRFCMSDDEWIDESHLPYLDIIDEPGKFTNNAVLREQLKEAVVSAWEQTVSQDGDLPFSHNCYLKLWELGDPRIPGKYILIDEAQDLNPLMLSILRKNLDAQQIFVGDEYQQIYSWNGAVDALNKIGDAASVNLTGSFRFGAQIEEVANDILCFMDASVRIRGLGKSKEFRQGTPFSTDAHVPFGSAVLCRTNAGVVGSLAQLIGCGHKPKMHGDATSLLLLIRECRKFRETSKSSHYLLEPFLNWKDLEEYARESEDVDAELATIVNLFRKFDGATMEQTIGQCIHVENPSVIVTTAHKAKGCEWPAVFIGGDWSSNWTDEDFRLFYVAATRARETLVVHPLVWDHFRACYEEKLKSGTRARPAAEANTPTETQSSQAELFGQDCGGAGASDEADAKVHHVPKPRRVRASKTAPVLPNSQGA